MRKVFLGFVIILAAVALLAQFILPAIATSAIKAKVVSRLSTDDVDVSMQSAPNVLLAIGDIDKMNIVVHRATIGAVHLRDLTLQGKKVHIDMASFLEDQAVSVSHAEQLSLRGVIGENELRRVLEEKISRLDNVEVRITPDGITATANTKLFGRKADIALTGKVVEDEGTLFIKMTSLNIKNALIGTAKLDDMFGNIELLKAEKMPMGLKITNIVHQDGEVIIEAERRPDK